MSSAHEFPERKDRQILVVDDDGPVREMLVRVLNEDGYSAWPAGDGEDALKLAATVPFEVVLLDLGLPGKTGWETFERLTLRNPLPAVIVITAKPEQRDIARAAGAAAFFEKPLDFPLLLQTVEQLVAEPPETRIARMLGTPERNL